MSVNFAPSTRSTAVKPGAGGGGGAGRGVRGGAGDPAGPPAPPGLPGVVGLRGGGEDGAGRERAEDGCSRRPNASGTAPREADRDRHGEREERPDDVPEDQVVDPGERQH